jgi:hypothetical protein
LQACIFIPVLGLGINNEELHGYGATSNDSAFAEIDNAGKLFGALRLKDFVARGRSILRLEEDFLTGGLKSHWERAQIWHVVFRSVDQ